MQAFTALLLSMTLPQASVRCVDRTNRAGIAFRHENSATDEKYLVETMGAGGGFLDYDGDLDLDVTNFGANVFYRNNGDGTFTDITEHAGVATGGWSTSDAFGNADGDGLLDWLVCRYVDYRLDNHKFCSNLAENIPAYCHPDVYNADPSVLYRNQGDGTFSDVTAEAGVTTSGESKSLGVVWGDYDTDGDQDIYVANDWMRNFLFQHDGSGAFHDVTLLACVGYSEDGQAQAGMGADLGDYDNDGWLDIIVTDLDFEYNALYRGDASGIFADVSYNSGLAEPSLNYVSFGTFFFDNDNDNDNDNDGWLALQLVGAESNRDGVGARVSVQFGDRVVMKEVKAESSYLSQSALELTFGLGDNEVAKRVEIRWPSGAIETLEEIHARSRLTLVEGKKINAKAQGREGAE